MKLSDMIGAWKLAARGPSSWLAYCAGEADSVALARACAATLARQMEPTKVFCDLLGAGEFDAAELFLQATGAFSGFNAEVLHDLETRLEQARTAAVEIVRGKLADLQIRAATHEVVVNEGDVVRAVKRRKSAGVGLLEQEERRIEDAETSVVQQLRSALAQSDPGGLDSTAYAEWHVSVEHAISLGALEAARAAIEMGPSGDRPPLVGVPSPPVWPYRSEPLHFVVDWMFGEGVIPPGFERYRPKPDDRDAWRLLKALREGASLGTAAVLHALAGVVGSKVIDVKVRDNGVLGRLDNLGAQGFHAFGPRAWPSGIPVWLPGGEASAHPDDVDNGLVIEVSVGPKGEAARHVLRLDVHDILAVLEDREHRRGRLLAQLGRQLPLDRAFVAQRADASVRWERSDLPPGLASGDHPVLLVGAPGMGKSTLLLELAETQGERVRIASAVAGGDLPDVDLILIEDADRLGADELRVFIRDVHWARTTRTPPRRVFVATRPEKVPVIERVAKMMFDVVELPPRSSAALREQARTMLGWIGVEATSPGCYERLAFLAGGNPTVLFLLCRALTKALACEGINRRRFTPHHVQLACEDSDARARVRELLWTPIKEFDGASDTLRVLVDFCVLGETISLANITWALNETLGERQEEWIVERLTLLRRYGLVREVKGSFGLRLGWAGMLVRSWLEEDSRER